MFENRETLRLLADLEQFLDDIIDYVRHSNEVGTAGADEETKRNKMQCLLHYVFSVYAMKYSREKTNLLLNLKTKRVICSN